MREVSLSVMCLALTLLGAILALLFMRRLRRVTGRQNPRGGSATSSPAGGHDGGSGPVGDTGGWSGGGGWGGGDSGGGDSGGGGGS